MLLEAGVTLKRKLEGDSRARFFALDVVKSSEALGPMRATMTVNIVSRFVICLSNQVSKVRLLDAMFRGTCAGTHEAWEADL